MVSKFTGRDYTTLRQEIIEFLRQRLPNTWDYTNAADPVVIFAESMARLGDQLHFTIDELRRECDVATATRASSIYSYAMREGYKMMLPKSSNGVLSINSTDATSDRMRLTMHRFDEIKVGKTDNTLYVDDGIDVLLHNAPNEEYIKSIRGDMNDYAAYMNNILERTARVKVVLGQKKSYTFTYNDINTDSTVTLPDPLIDRDLISLVVKTDKDPSGTEWEYVSDVIASGFVGKIYTLTPKFIGGAITLNIEFASNYKNLFGKDAKFELTYIKIQDGVVDDDRASEIDLSSFITDETGDDNFDPSTYVKTTTVTIDTNGDPVPVTTETGNVIISLNGGIRGYQEYEDATTTRENYKHFVQDYSALLTKEDYKSFIKQATNSFCTVYDHSDNYKQNVLPYGTSLLPRVIYILTEAKYSERERLWLELIERSSRSDVIILMPYGKDPYTIVVEAECFLMGSSITEVSTQIKTELLDYYGDSFGKHVPEVSMINYLVHKASDKVIRMDSCVVRDSTFGAVDSAGALIINDDFNDVNSLSNDDLDKLFNAIKSGTDCGSINGKDNRLVEGAYHKYEPVKYKSYPDKFPSIYLVDGSGNEIEQTGDSEQQYLKLVQHQITYGSFDRKEWDLPDSEIFEETPSGTYRNIRPEYIKHHYMLPYLNRIIVLVKSIGN